MSFRRTAITLIAIALVTAGIAAVYLWFNFNARSNLILVVPKNARWFYHFQTSVIRKNTYGEKPVYLDSLVNSVKNLRIFQKVADPGSTGIKPMSDLVLFGNEWGDYAALSLSSEDKFRDFLKSLPHEVFSGQVSETSGCSFLKIPGRNLYVAFKNKALVLFRPYDTSDRLDLLEKGLGAVFSENNRESIAVQPEVKLLYDKGCDIICYHNTHFGMLSHGVIVRNARARFISAKSGREIIAREPLKIFDFVLHDKVRKNKTITSNNYLNLTFKCMYTLINEW